MKQSSLQKSAEHIPAQYSQLCIRMRIKWSWVQYPLGVVFILMIIIIFEFEWMKHTGLKGETEGLITAAQDQALNTRYYSKHIIKTGYY